MMYPAGGVNPTGFVIWTKAGDASATYNAAYTVTLGTVATPTFATTTQCKYSLMGLAPGTAYQVKVEAKNKVGSSPLSGESDPVTTTAVTSKVAFGMTIDLEFSQWETKRPSIVSAIGSVLKVDPLLVEILHAHAGSTVLQVEVATSDPAGVSQSIRTLRVSSTSGQQLLANYSVLTVSQPTNLTTVGTASINTISPTIGEAGASTAVTLTGEGFSAQSDCTVDGETSPLEFRSQFSVVCTVTPTVLSRRSGPSVSQMFITVTSGRNAKAFYAYAPFSLESIVPSSGFAVGGAAGGGPVDVDGGRVMMDLLNSGPALARMVAHPSY